MSKFTHSGYVRGCDARTPKEYRRKVQLRETKCYWIDKHGTRYSKKWDGSTPGDWPMFKLDLETIELMESEDE